MKNSLNEAYKVSRSKDLKQQPIAFVDPNAPENKNTFKYKEILKKHGAKWSLNPMFKNNFPPHSNGFWFWFLGPTEEQWQRQFDNFIKPALKEIHEAEGASPEESQSSMVSSLDAVIEKITSAEPTFDSSAVLTDEIKKAIKDKLEGFKRILVNIKDDEQFKKTMKNIMAFKNAQGHEFSLMNSILVIIQKPDAKIVKSKTNWYNLYNRTINQGAKPIWLMKPSELAKRKYSKNEIDALTAEFLKRENKARVKDLGPGQMERLNVLLSGRVTIPKFELYNAYDVSDTTLIEGKPDPIQDILNKEEIPWFEGDLKDEKVKPIYFALMNYAKEKGIEVELTDDKKLGGARGMSASGKIYLLQNEGNDVGTTKTFVHELAHELLHQTYAKGRSKELEQYFLGTQQGRHLVEQQAELTAWMVMAAFGFDLQTTSINYTMLWGADDKSMISVFDSVSKITNYLIKEIASRGNELSEGNIPMGKKFYTPMDVAKILGVENKYKEVLTKYDGGNTDNIAAQEPVPGRGGEETDTDKPSSAPIPSRELQRQRMMESFYSAVKKKII